MITFKHKVDGFLFTAEPSTITHRVLMNDDNYEIVEPPKKKVTSNGNARKTKNTTGSK